MMIQLFQKALSNPGPVAKRKLGALMEKTRPKLVQNPIKIPQKKKYTIERPIILNILTISKASLTSFENPLVPKHAMAKNAIINTSKIIV